MIDTPQEPQKPSHNSRVRNLLLLTLGFVITLLAGVAIGLQLQPEATVVQVVVTATPDPAFAENNADATQPSADSSADTPDLMTFLLSDARHSQGDADAPITLIEFSDFK